MEVKQSFFKKVNEIGVVIKTMVHGSMTKLMIEQGWKQIEATDYVELRDAKHAWLTADGEVMNL